MKTKDIIEKAIKEAREKRPGIIISRDDIYNAIFKAGRDSFLDDVGNATIPLSEAYKAGYAKRESEFVYNPDYLDFQKGVKTGRGLGRKEVVEWLKKHGIYYHGTLYDEIEKQLKEWGIE